MARYIWQTPDWADQLRWDRAALLELLARARRSQGELLGKAFDLGFDVGQQIQLATVTAEAIGTSSIEGESLDRGSVRSSVARRLGLEAAGAAPTSRPVDGLVEVLVDATSSYEAPLTAEWIFGWQAALFPTGFSGTRRVAVGGWRSTADPMEVVSGPLGRETVHYEAPPSSRVPAEMRGFLDWWNAGRGVEEGMLRAALAHFRFVTVHPFEDGNGRIARALADMALAQDERTGLRLYSLSAGIRAEREDYYRVLERTQRGDGDVTAWLAWFLGMFARALERSDVELEGARAKERFWRRNAPLSLTPRQIRVLNRLLDAEPEGFDGGLTTKKYASMAHTSESTAKREILDLLARELIVQTPGTAGRSTRYELRRDG